MRHASAVPFLTFAMVACAQTPAGDATARGPAPSQPTETAITRNATVAREDGAIHADVLKAVRSEKMLEPRGIRVQTRAGEVELTGVVKSPDERQRAEGLARSIPGVKHVENRLELAK